MAKKELLCPIPVNETFRCSTGVHTVKGVIEISKELFIVTCYKSGVNSVYDNDNLRLREKDALHLWSSELEKRKHEK